MTKLNKYIQVPKNPVIWCDCDGVLADMIGGLCNEFNKDFCEGYRVFKPEGVTQWEIVPYFGDKVYEKFAQRGFWENLEVYPEASHLVETLTKGKLRWGILTAIHHSLAPLGANERINWFIKNFGMDYRYWDLKIVFAACKSIIINQNILIDDRFSTCLDVVKSGGVPICVARSWNEEEYESYKTEDFPHGYFPRYNLNKIISIIKQLEVK